MEYRPFWCNIDHKFKNIDHLSKMVDYRPMVDNIDPVAGLYMQEYSTFESFLHYYIPIPFLPIFWEALKTASQNLLVSEKESAVFTGAVKIFNETSASALAFSSALASISTATSINQHKHQSAVASISTSIGISTWSRGSAVALGPPGPTDRGMGDPLQMMFCITMKVSIFCYCNCNWTR